MSFLAYLFRTTFEMPIKSYAVSKSSTVIDFTFHVAFCDWPKEFKSGSRESCIWMTSRFFRLESNHSQGHCVLLFINLHVHPNKQ